MTYYLNMAQVLDTLCYADRMLLSGNMLLADAAVFVHLSSHIEARAKLLDIQYYAMRLCGVTCRLPSCLLSIAFVSACGAPLDVIACSNKSRLHVKQARHSFDAWQAKRGKSRELFCLAGLGLARESNVPALVVQGLNATLEWGCLSRRDTWRTAPAGLLRAWWLGSNPKGQPKSPQRALPAPVQVASPPGAVWPGAEAAEVESVTLAPAGLREAGSAALEAVAETNGARGVSLGRLPEAETAAEASAQEKKAGVQQAEGLGTSEERASALDGPDIPLRIAENRRQSTTGACGEARVGAAEGEAALLANSANLRSEPRRGPAYPAQAAVVDAFGVELPGTRSALAEAAAGSCESASAAVRGHEGAECNSAVQAESARRISSTEAATPVTVREIVSEWLLSGYEVSTVSKGGARPHAVAALSRVEGRRRP